MSKKKETSAENEPTENEVIQPEAQEISIEEQLTKDINQEKDKFLRLFAEFENYKKRTSRERIELFKTANEELMTVLLPVLDDFDRGLTELKKNNDEQIWMGMELINNKLKNSLIQKGLTIMTVAAGEDFDVDIHEAITQIPAPSENLKGKIIDVIEQGYKLGEKVIRYPRVVVGQ